MNTKCIASAQPWPPLHYERFALIRFEIKNGRLWISDAIGKEAKWMPIEPFRWLKLRSSEVMLVGNNGTGINFDRKIHGKWEHIMNLSAGPKLLGRPTPDFDMWEYVLHIFRHLDINDNEVWGLGKWKSQARLPEKEIVARLERMRS